MKKLLILFITTIVLGSCASVKKYNADINTLRSEEQLKSDVDYVYKKLQKLHPRLYWYVSKNELDYKFDSLKSSINEPMTSNDFYFKLCPVLASVRQGHLQLYPLTEKMKNKDRKQLKKKGTSPLMQFEFELFDNKLYIVNNKSNDTTIKPGTELLTANNSKPDDLIEKYRYTFSSDGYNQTLFNRRLSKNYPYYYYYQNGRTDSVLLQLKFNDSVRSVCIKRKSNKTVDSIQISKKDTLSQAKKNDQKKRDIQGYNSILDTYSKNLSFAGSDSSIAIMKITDFYNGNYRKFFRNSFRQIDSLKTKTLVLDLRDNYGGGLHEIIELYSYLAENDFYFMDKAEVVSRTSLWHTNYFGGRSWSEKAILTVFLPFRLIGMGVIFSKVRKEDGKYYYTFADCNKKHPKSNPFKGKVYVIINGGSFSATSILSANLKSNQRAMFVGEETGGAYNGCVAGKLPVFTLPETKLRFCFGLAFIQPCYPSDVDGRGIFPEIEIKPTVNDRISGYDPEFEWILDDIKCRESSDEKR